jgi:glycosyltransferase involved in cell wall biosynthesis
MKILWLSHFVPYPATGHGALQRTHHLLRQAARRHEVHLVSVSQPGTLDAAGLLEADRELATLVASVRLFPLPADRRGLHRGAAVARSVAGARSYWDEWFHVPAMAAEVRRLAAAHAFDAVHLDAVFLAPYLDAVPGVPLVLNHHNLESHLLHRRAAAHGSRAGAWFFANQARKVEAAEAQLAQRAAMNLVVSDLDGERLRVVAPHAAVTTVANGVDIEFFQPTPGVAPTPGAVVFAGGMDWFPNRAAIQWLATDVWPTLARDNPDRAVTVIGRNPPAEIVDLAARDGRVRALGFVDDVRPHISRAAAYVCPIQVGGGTRLKILDALAMRRPLVSTAVGVEGLGMTEGVHYLAAETPDAFSQQLGRLERDPALGARLATAGRAFVEERYSWATIGDVLGGAYEAAVQRAER